MHNLPENSALPERDEEWDEDEGYTASSTLSPPPQHPRRIKDKTRDLYLSYVKTLRKKFLAVSPEAHTRDVQPIDLVDHLIARAPNVRPKTFINYRSGLLYWINSLPESAETHHARLVLQVGVPKSGFKGPKPGKTSTLYSSRSSRPRTFKRRQFESLIAELNQRSARGADRRNGRRAAELMVWLQAGLASGLRPSEWESAKWMDQSRGLLLVRTAKRKTDVNALPSLSGLPPPEQKERVVEIDAEDRIWVDQHLNAVRRHLLTQQPFSSYYDNNRVYLWNICRDLFGDSRPPFTLYMMRGQYSANRKRRGVPVDVVAAQMGCAPKVTQTYYGKRQHGHRSSMPDRPVTAPRPEKAAPAQAQRGAFSFNKGSTSNGGRSG
ncbi:hypothetical protein [Achromobacter anxifer]|uniref:hypothetical protein n=1 Tax=Achromobacter anxifer TaxID=1287737 RepID=UPI0023FA14DD|nr:hypothetical protein [Achromobacter anxifer]MDF8363263.1 hypothetical protein [Achromobacter anxifer]